MFAAEINANASHASNDIFFSASETNQALKVIERPSSPRRISA
jgi:hypothetical protein